MKTTSKKTKQTTLKSTSIVMDYPSIPELETLQRALKPFGVVVMAYPGTEGAGTLGFVFSNRKLTKDEKDELRNAC